MACSGCEARRQAIKRAAGYVFGKVNVLISGKKAAAAPPVVKPSNEDAGRKAINKRRK